MSLLTAPTRLHMPEPLAVCAPAAVGRLAWAALAGWLSLMVAAQAATLILTAAGPVVRYQHLRPVADWFDPAVAIAVTVLFVQSLAVGVGLWRARSVVADVVKRLGRPRQFAAVAAVFVLTSAVASLPAASYAVEVVVASLLQATSLGAVFLVVRALPASFAARLSAWADRPSGADRLTFVMAAAVTAASAGLAVWPYERHPHVPDEVVYLIHARYFAEGRLTLPAPPVREAFDVDLMSYEDDHWYCPVPPGWPAALSVGAYLGVPWLVNPVLAGLNVVLTSLLLNRLYDYRTARLATVLLAISPWALFMGMNLMTHTFTLTCALTAALGVARWRDGGTASWAFAGGAAAGLVGLTRPLEGAIVVGLLGLWLVGRRLIGIVAFAAGVALVGGITFPYNHALTGSATTFPINAYCDRAYGPGHNSLGFGPDRGLAWGGGLDPFPGHGSLDVLVNANFNLFAVNGELFGWASGSLWLPALAVCCGVWSRGDRLMIAAASAVIAAHSFYWFSGGPDFGARYWYLVIVPCVALAARGVELLGGRLGDAAADRGRALAAVGCLTLAAWVTFVPWRATDKYFHYRGMRAELRDIAEQRGFGRSLVLVRGHRHPDYASAAAFNPLRLTADAPVYAWDRSPQVRRQVLTAYADRRVWLVDGPTLTGRGYEIVAGPIAARELLMSEGAP